MNRNTFLLSSLFFYFLLTFQILPQIQVENLLGLSEVTIPAGYDKFIVSSTDNKNIVTYLLFGKPDRSIMVASGKSVKKVNFKSEITAIKELKSKKRNSGLFAYISRKERTAGVFSLKSDKTIKIEKDIQLNSYPENLAEADLDNDGNSEMLVSGSAFSGLSIITFTNGKLTETKVEKNYSFSEAVFIDLNNDKVKDIAAYNILTGSLDFYYNNTVDGFYKARSIPFKTPVKQLKCVNYNKDVYEDLIYLQNNDFQLMLGDKISAYKSIVNYYPKDKITSFESLDINSDGFNDILYFNYNKGVLNVITGKGTAQVYDEFPVHRVKYLSALYVDRKSGEVSMLSTTGKVRVIRPEKSGNLDNIAIGVDISIVKGFDYLNDKINDYYFFDNYDNALKIALFNKKSKPAKYLSFILTSKPELIEADDHQTKTKYFYCYKTNDKLIEIVKADLSKGEFKRVTTYAPGKILEIKNIGKEKTAIVYVNNEMLYSALISFKDNGKFSNIIPLTKNYLYNPVICKDGIYYWQKSAQGVTLIKSISKNETAALYTITGKVTSIKNIQGTGLFFAVVNNDKNNNILFIDSLNVVNYVDSKSIKTQDETVTDIYNNKLFVYSFSEKKNEFIVSTMVENEFKDVMKLENINAQSVYVNQYQGVRQLVFSNNLLNCISIKKLD